MASACFVLLFGCSHIGSVLADELVSVESLLNEMVDRDGIARFPSQDFRLRQHSSYNRASKSPGDPKGWFNNKDFSTKGSPQDTFIRVEENRGRKEWVLMDHEGPGAIVRTWMPFRAVPRGVTLRVYLDGAAEPALEGNPCTLFNGDGLVPYPFAHSSLLSAVSFFPIPYAKSCKVTLSEQPFFFQFTFREYEQGTSVKTFTLAQFEAAKTLVNGIGSTLLHPPSGEGGMPLATTATLASKEEVSLKLPQGSAAVRELSIKLGDYSDAEVTRHVVLKMEFDNKVTVWCPIGDFFGSGIGLNPFQGWYRTVADDGTMSCRWVMPYQQSASFSVLNLGDKSVNVELKAVTDDWSWDERSMLFHASWRGQYPVATRPYSDWNYVTLKGRGVYVGDTLTIMNPVERWWGEGDEKIWVDGEGFPSIFGTGTEDYYAYSWGGLSTDFYEHPFHAQPRSHAYNKLVRKTTGEKNTRGYSTETRSRSLDTMPFETSLRLDMEVWSWSDCEMGYGVGAYWYGFGDSVSIGNSEPTEVLNVPPLPTSVIAANSSELRKRFENAVEIEQANVASQSGSIILKPQNLKSYKGTWNAGDHVLFKNARVGDVVELRLLASMPVAQKLVLHATKSFDFGVLEFAVNGEASNARVDLYSPKPTSSGPIILGAFEPLDGYYMLQVKVVDKNPRSKGALFGLDCVVVEEASE